MRHESRQEREQWTAHIEGRAVSENKYGNDRSKDYASKHEAAEAQKLWALESRGIIRELKEQVPFTLVEGDGKIRPIKYIADFTFIDGHGMLHICDAKGYSKDKVYRLKKKLMWLMLGLEIEEL